MQANQYPQEPGLLGELSPREKKLEGKTFYLDNVKKRSTALLLEAVSLLGGRVESFLHKDVNFVVTGSQEGLKEEKCVVTKGEAKDTSEGTQHQIKQQERGLGNDKQWPGTPRPMVCGSRGKALLEKAMRNKERLQGSSVLSNARSWGVKILYVDDVILYLKQLTRESFSAKQKRAEKSCTKQQGFTAVKAAALRAPYLKIEDLSRKYKPLHMQSMTFPTLCYLGRYSPFESPPPPRFDKRTEPGENKTREKKVESSIQDKFPAPLSCNPSPWRPRKKDLSYCECCHLPFTNLDEHLQSDQHRAFVLDPSHYSTLDDLVAEMLPGFNPNPCQQSEDTINRPPTPLPIHDVCELEPLTDVETEHAVQALQRQSSFNTHISSPTRNPLSFSPASPSPEVQFTIPNPVTPPADIQSFNPETDCQFPDIHPLASSPAMPVLNAEPQAQDSLNQQPEPQHLSPCSSAPCPLPDPYSLPPVLSPQVPYSPYMMDPRSPYSEAPVLSPQQYTEEAADRQTCEMNTAESESKFVSAGTVPLSTPLLISAAVINTEGVKGLNQDGPVGFSGRLCLNTGLERGTLSSRRPHSLPRLSATAPKPRKRCRSASPEHSRSKRRRTATFGYSDSWTEHWLPPTKPQSDNTAKVERCLLFDRPSCEIIQPPTPNVSSLSSIRTGNVLGSKQTYSTFCFPTVQSFTQEPNHTDSVSNQPSCLLPTKASIFDPPLDFPNGKPHRAVSSQDSQRSLSHSTSVCIEPALIPDLAALSPSSSDSDWDCNLLSRLGPTSATPSTPAAQNCELDKELLHRPCPWMHDTSYESHLHTVLQPSTPAASLCGEEMDPSAFSRTVVQIVQVQH